MISKFFKQIEIVVELKDPQEEAQQASQAVAAHAIYRTFQNDFQWRPAEVLGKKLKQNDQVEYYLVKFQESKGLFLISATYQKQPFEVKFFKNEDFQSVLNLP